MYDSMIGPSSSFGAGPSPSTFQHAHHGHNHQQYHASDFAASGGPGPYMPDNIWSAVRRSSWHSRPGEDMSSSERGGITSSDDHSSASPGSGNRLAGLQSAGRAALAAGAGLSMNRMVCDFSDLKDIGGGDFGVVTAATYDLDGQRYAIKSLRKPITGEIDLQRRLQEVYALSSCASPHLLRYHDAWIQDGVVYLRTELLSGGNLLRRPPPWPEEELWDLMRQLALGIQAMHTANIAHLDIKPDNCFSSQSDAEPFGVVYKIGDFGLARPVEGSATGEHFFGINDDEGDCRYLCPVFLANGVSCGLLREADMYALGSSVVHLTGGDPRLLRNGVYSSLAGYSIEFQSLIKSLTDPEPRNRPTADDVVDVCYRRLAPLLPPSDDVIVANNADDEELAALVAELQALEAEENGLFATSAEELDTTSW